MPLYQYQCDCGLKFDLVVGMGDYNKPQKCPSCNSDAPRIVPDDVNGVFNYSVSGPTPQNTGVSNLDSHIDQVIGKSAEDGRKSHVDRINIKKELLRNNPGAEGKDITRTKDGEFILMSSDERKARDTALSVNNQAMNTIKQMRNSIKEG